MQASVEENRCSEPRVCGEPTLEKSADLQHSDRKRRGRRVAKIEIDDAQTTRGGRVFDGLKQWGFTAWGLTERLFPAY